MNKYMADFETLAGDNLPRTDVWAWCICKLESFDDKLLPVGNNIWSFFNFLYNNATNGDLIFFHNLKFDGEFIIAHLAKNKFEYCMEDLPDYKRKPHTYNVMMDAMGKLFDISVTLKRGITIHFRDSLKLLPFTVEKIGKGFETKYRKLNIDYKAHTAPGQEITDKERVYIENDVRVVAEALLSMFNEGYDGMTIGSCAMKYYQKDILGGKKQFRDRFPILTDSEIKFIAPARKGGWCYVNDNIQGKILGKGYTVDFNSMYPSQMHSASGNMYPLGKGVYFTCNSSEVTEDPDYPLWIAKVQLGFSLKENRYPCIQIKDNISLFGEHEYIKESDDVVTITITSVDWYLINQCYDIWYCKFLDGYKYQAAIGMFDKYIDKFYEMKQFATNPQKRQQAKLFLNNFYGKFVMRTEIQTKIPAVSDANIVSWTIQPAETRDPVYPPVGIFTTAYARREVVTAANNNYSSFCYADTDSLHCLGNIEDEVGMKLDNKKLMHWKHESDWTRAKFVRQKTYAEEIDCKLDIKCAGAPKILHQPASMQTEEWRQNNPDSTEREVKLSDILNLDNFDIGFSTFGKLKPKHIPGGIILVPSAYVIRPV